MRPKFHTRANKKRKKLLRSPHKRKFGIPKEAIRDKKP